MNLAILGSGSHAKVIADIAKDIGYENIFFFDDKSSDKKNIKKIISLKKNIGTSDKLYFFPGVGNNQERKEFFQFIKKNKLKTVNIIHRTAVISKNIKIGNANLIMPNVVINNNASIGSACILNTSSVIEHDVRVGNYSHISPKSCLLGNVKIGNECWIGANSVIRENIIIKNNITVAAGSTIVKNISKKGIYINSKLK